VLAAQALDKFYWGWFGHRWLRLGNWSRQKRDTNKKVALPICYRYISICARDNFPSTDFNPMAAYDLRMPRQPASSRSEIGERLYQLRVTKGLTQKQLAEKVGVNQQDIAYWERQAPAPRGDIISKLCAVLDVSSDELLGIRPLKSKRESPVGRARQLFDAVSKLPRRQQEKIFDILAPFVKEHVNGHAKAA
jgi:transcriptional regulator with XRE-family HTH domain